MARVGMRVMHPELAPLGRVLAAARAAPAMFGEFRRWARSHCEVAQLLCDRLGLGATVRDSMGVLYERWDGSGFPGGVQGEALPPALRVMHVAQDAEIAWREGGVPAARELIEARAGRGHDPAVSALFDRHADEVLAGLDSASLWDQLLDAEPGTRPVVDSPARLEDCLTVVADFADLKTTRQAGHSRNVAQLAADAAALAGLAPEDIRELRQAGFVHDVGRVAVSAGIWMQTTPLSRDALERVRLAPYYTERILDRQSAYGRLRGWRPHPRSAVTARDIRAALVPPLSLRRLESWRPPTRSGPSSTDQPAASGFLRSRLPLL